MQPTEEQTNMIRRLQKKGYTPQAIADAMEKKYPMGSTQPVSAQSGLTPSVVGTPQPLNSTEQMLSEARPSTMPGQKATIASSTTSGAAPGRIESAVEKAKEFAKPGFDLGVEGARDAINLVENWDTLSKGERWNALGNSLIKIPTGVTETMFGGAMGAVAGGFNPEIEMAGKGLATVADTVVEDGSEKAKAKLGELATMAVEEWDTLDPDTQLMLRGVLAIVLPKGTKGVMQEGSQIARRAGAEFAEGAIAGGRAGMALGDEAATLGATAIKKEIGVGLKVAGEVKDAARSTLSATVEQITKPRLKGPRNALAESMLNSFVKVDPVKGAENFYKLSKGQTMGGFLLERDIIGTAEQVIQDLSKRFTKVKGSFDEAIGAMDGNYKFPVADEILREMELRFTKTLDKQLPRVQTLIKKYKAEGLTMAENLELKRLYESKVKTGYLKDNVSELVDRATNLDNELRESFVAEAKKSGFANVSDLSREIQLTRAAMDSIESKHIRSLVNNQFGLTDNLLLIGGAINPGALAILGIKKIGSSPSIQAKIVRALVTNDIKIMKEIPNIPKEVISLKNDLKRKKAFEEWLESSGIKAAADGTEQLKLPEGGSIQSKSPVDITEARSQQFKDGTGVFDQGSVIDKATPITTKSSAVNIKDNIPEVSTKNLKKSSFSQGETPSTTKI